ncbi:hypothetical protein EHP00_829 [Ecytonucleospora hepatopenaei]|uniref:Uncharacterized protein n=1 Tax=Ecytonucleospora hepatopenaei TaxID=646526 RepID=A0A1W0E8A7_9MICR|nr:hypothetical protein EHP00_829 [Ecytonucleospora hepatopenaei]
MNKFVYILKHIWCNLTHKHVKIKLYTVMPKKFIDNVQHYFQKLFSKCLLFCLYHLGLAMRGLSRNTFQILS